MERISKATEDGRPEAIKDSPAQANECPGITWRGFLAGVTVTGIFAGIVFAIVTTTRDESEPSSSPVVASSSMDLPAASLQAVPSTIALGGMSRITANVENMTEPVEFAWSHDGGTDAAFVDRDGKTLAIYNMFQKRKVVWWKGPGFTSATKVTVAARDDTGVLGSASVVVYVDVR